MPDVFSTVSDVDSHVVLDYTSRDFTAIRSQLVGLARGIMPEWETAGEASDFGTLLLELFAYMGDVMHFYIDRTASEAFLGTALRRQSVLYIADMLGYTPIGQQSAIVKLLFALTPLDTTDPNVIQDSVEIPAGSRIFNNVGSSDDVIVFELNTAVTLNPGDTDVIGYATEGVMHYDYLLGTSNGMPNTEFIIPDKGVVYNSITMQSREGPDVLQWSYISDLSLARPTQPVFTTFIDEAEFTHIVFGDQAAGRIPPVNAEIFVSYRTGVGAEANDLAPGDLVNIRTQDTTIDLFSVTVSNPDSPVGGTDPETIDAMRNSIPRAATRLKSRAITLNDYADLAMQVPGVAKSMAHGAVYTSVHVRIAPIQGQADDVQMALLCDNVEAYLSDKIIVGSAVNAEPRGVDPASDDAIIQLWQYVQIRMMVHVQDSYNRTSIRKGVEAAIRQMLDFNNVDFGTRVSIGSIYRVALSIQGVEWVDLFWLDPNDPDDPAPLDGDGVPYPATDEQAIWTNDDTRRVADIDTIETLIPKITPPMVVKVAKVTNKVLAGNVVTLVTAHDHGMVVGDIINVTDLDTPPTPVVFNGQFTITTVPNTTSLTYAVVHADVTSAAVTAGTVTQVDPNRPEMDSWWVDDPDGPQLSADERTHDGLWVQAVGGLPGT
jgi:hypothetical protein